ncbi:prestin-like [Littorina saxatilis]|uniref:prestin-like n=1 Tax=Littorina saxatilis TaxID=31220 RepID=UPI0038B4FEA4
MVTTPVTPTEHVILRRHLYTQVALDDTYKDQSESSTACDVIKRTCQVSPKCVGRQALNYFPVAKTLRGYKWRQWVFADIISGLSVAFIQMPLGLGLGLLASLKPVNGLYTTFFPILVYLFFGTSPHVSMGTNAVIALLTAGLVERETEHLVSALGVNETLSEEELLEYKVGIAAASCFVGGLILLGMGILRLGFITNFLAKSFIGGFTFAAAVHISTSQIVKMLHLKLPMRTGLGKLVLTYIDIFSNIRDVNVADLIVGLICMAVLLAVKLGINERYKHKLTIPIPIELIVVILSTLVSHFAKLNEKFGIVIVGDVPVGIPAPSLPRLESLPRVATDAFVTAILIFALTISLAKLTAKLHDVIIDDNQELVAYGLCQLVGSFFQNFPSCTALPRTMMLSSLGSKSTLNGVTSAVFILLVMLVVGQLFVSLPIAMLAAMIIVAMKDLLLQIRNLKPFWHVNKPDFFIWILTAFVSVFGDLDIGLLAGVVFSMVTVLVVSQLAKGTLLGKANNEDVIVDLDRKGVSAPPGVKIFRFESALYFASQERFKNQLFSLVMNPTTSPRKDRREKVIPDVSKVGLDNPNKVNLDESNGSDLRNSNTQVEKPNTTEQPEKDTTVDAIDNVSFENGKGEEEGEGGSFSRLHHLILDCSAMTYIDMSGLDMLQLMVTQFSRAGVEVWLAGVPASTLSTLARAGFGDKVGMEKVFYSVFDALERLRRDESIVVRM